MDKARLQDVAAQAGVSLSTASKALNGRSDVSQDLARKVSQAAEQLGYVSRRRGENAGARSLTIVFDSLTSPYALQVLDGAIRSAKRMGVGLETTSMQGVGAGPTVLSDPWLRQLVARGEQGLIVVTTPVADAKVRWCRSHGLPLILVDPASPNAEHVVAISATNWAGGKQATDHLLDLGHRRIGFVAGPADSVPAAERLQGFRSALQQRGLEPGPGHVVDAGFDSVTGRLAALRLLHGDERPTAIFAASDASAVGVLKAAAELGLQVPGDLSVMGFDDTPVAAWTSPALTTVRQPLASMGQVAVERALALASDPELFAHPFQLETRLITRDSTGAPHR